MNCKYKGKTYEIIGCGWLMNRKYKFYILAGGLEVFSDNITQLVN